MPPVIVTAAEPAAPHDPLVPITDIPTVEPALEPTVADALVKQPFLSVIVKEYLPAGKFGIV